MTDSTTGDLERRVARGICHSKGIDPDMCVAGHGAMPGEPGFICQQYAWELELPTTRAALKAIAEGGYAIFDKSCLDSPPAQQEDQHHD